MEKTLREEKTLYLVYRITNILNDKTYVGCHQTKNPNDTYMGSGKILLKSQKKHGLENFKKDILFEFQTPEEMFAKEAEIVNADYVKSGNTYNLKEGGYGGWSHINNGDSDHIARCSRNGKIQIKRYQDGVRSGKFKRPSSQSVEFGRYRSNLALSPEAREKRKVTFAENLHSQGVNNSQFGSMWIFSENEKKSKKIFKGDPIPEGWEKGRKMKFSDLVK